MVIIIEQQDIDAFNRAVHKSSVSNHYFGIPQNFVYAARIIAKYENGETEMIKNRYTEMEAKGIIDAVASAFDRRKKIDIILE
jgi:hypothetical protein